VGHLILEEVSFTSGTDVVFYNLNTLKVVLFHFGDSQNSMSQKRYLYVRKFF
jgi:hypothetical protein